MASTKLSPLPPGVPSGAKSVIITSIINPSCFWGHEHPKEKKLTVDDEKLAVLETEMTKLYSSQNSDNIIPAPEENQLVAVYDSTRNKWVRGIVKKWSSAGREVFLVDYGSYLCNVKNVRKLLEPGRQIPPQSFQIFLYGVLPLLKVYNQDTSVFTYAVHSDWMPDAQRDVANLLMKASGFYFACSTTVEGAQLGDLFLIFKDVPAAISLTKDLCNKNMAEYDYDRFIREIANRVLSCSYNLTQTFDEQTGTGQMSSRSQLSSPSQGYQQPAFASGKGSPSNTPQAAIQFMPAGHVPKSVSTKKNQSDQHQPNQNYNRSQSNSGAAYPNQRRSPNYRPQGGSPRQENYRPQSGQRQSPQLSHDRSQGPREVFSDISPSVSGVSKLQPNNSMLSQLMGETSRTPRYSPNKSGQMVRNPDNPRPNLNFKKPIFNLSAGDNEPQPIFEQPIPGLHKSVSRGTKYGPTVRSGSLQRSPTLSTTSSTGSGDWHPSLIDLNASIQLPVLAQGCNLAKPLDSIRKASLHADIHRVLDKMNFQAITNQQKHMWPAILRGENVVSIGAIESGKTVGFVAPLASKMLDHGMHSEFKDCFGPLVLVVCKNAQKATQAESWFKRLAQNDIKDHEFSHNRGYQEPVARVKILLTYGGGAETEKLMDFINGCDVLITTPPCLVRMISYWKETLADMDRLCHLVFDDADVLFEIFNPEVGEILALCKSGLASKASKGRSLQIIAVSRQWTEAIEQFASKVLINPSIIVSSGIEILAYSKITPVFHQVQDIEQRPSIVMEIIKSLKVPLKIVVACNLQNEALEIHRFLKTENFKLLLAHERIDQSGVNDQRTEWHNTSMSVSTVLVVSDGVLSELEIFDADVLVNYSMPDIRSNLNTRIACLINKCPDRFQESKGEPPQVHLMMTEKDTKQIPVLVGLLKRLKQPIPDGFEEKVTAALKEKELAKKDAPMCDELCTFGSCSMASTTCSRRHGFLKETDECPPHMPQTGEVKLKVLHINSATHFVARLEEHKSPDGTVQNLATKEHVYLPMDISEYYENPSNRKMVGSNVSRGTICAVESSINLFQRVIVESYVEQRRDGSFTAVVVRSLDEGWRHRLKVTQLYYLPEKLQRPLPQAVDVFLCRVKPRDEDPSWSQAVIDHVIKWLNIVKSNEAKGYFLYGKIKLSVCGKLWVDPLECRQHLRTMGVPSILFSIRSRLLEQKLALDNPVHLSLLYKLCKVGGLTIPDYTNTTQRKETAPVRLSDETLKPRWAYLNQTELDVVNAIALHSPSSIFVQRLKFQSLLDDLLNNICDHQNENSFKTRKYTPTTPGSSVLAKYCDNMWYRAIIEKVEDEVQNLYLLLFVDFGDRDVVNIRNMLPIPDELLSKLPFQSIECSLANVMPASGLTWSLSAGDKLADLTRKDDDLMKPLVIKVVAKTKSSLTGGYRYAVKLYDVDAQCEVTEKLVESGLAKWLPNKGPDESVNWDEMKELVDKLLPLRFKKSHHIILTAEDISDDENGQEAENALMPYFEEEAEMVAPNEESDISLDHHEHLGANTSDEIDSELSDPDNDNLLHISDVSDSELASFLGDMTGDVTAQMMSKTLGAIQEQKQRNSTCNNTLAIEAHQEYEMQNFKENPKEQSSSFPDDELHISEETPTKLIKTAFEPTILWSQNHLWVTLKVVLSGVEKYDLAIGPSYVDFMTKTEGKVYFFSKNLFGYIDPEKSTHRAKGLHIEIKLCKLAYFQWLRLERSVQSGTKRTMLDVDVSFKDPDSDESDSDEAHNWLSPRWKTKNKLGDVGIAAGPNESVLHDLFDNDSNAEDETNYMQVETFDPYDPLA